MHASDDPSLAAPLKALDDWDDFMGEHVYPTDGARARDDYRDFESPTRDSVHELYRLNHRFQTLDFVVAKEAEYGSLDRRQMGTLEALEFLDTLIDDSDPDLELSQLQHLLQTSEAIRRDGHADWFVLTGLLHDLGKVLCLFGEPQWAVIRCRGDHRHLYERRGAVPRIDRDDRSRSAGLGELRYSVTWSAGSQRLEVGGEEDSIGVNGIADGPPVVVRRMEVGQLGAGPVMHLSPMGVDRRNG